MLSLFFLCLVGIVSGSSGDADYSFRVCVRTCFESPEHTSMSHSSKNARRFLPSVLHWDYLSECEYTCMRTISDSREEKGLPVLKYFGHWPYFRIFGLQEPASAFFSLLNALPHVYHILFNRHRLSDSFRCWVIAYGIMATIAWSCSTIFHARKVAPTIFMDYASALMFLTFGLFVALRRTLHLLIFQSRPYLSFLMFGGMSWVCLSRVAAMYQGHIGFDSHMSFSIGVAVLHTAVWIIWLLSSPHESISHKQQCLLLQLWFIAASMLELFDFPPIFYHFDAHSLWHCATIPLGHLWYQFWFQDAAVLKKLGENVLNDGGADDAKQT